MEIHIDANKPQEILEDISKKLHVKTTTSGSEVVVKLPKRYGEGYVSGIDFLDGTGMLCFEGFLNTDFILHYNGGNKQPIRFIFCTEGEIVHILDPDNFRYKLSAMIGSIACSSGNNEQVFMFPPKKKIQYHALYISKQHFFPKIEEYLHTIPEKLANLFKDVDSQDHFLYHSNYSLNIAECIAEIQNNPYEGMVRRIFLESKALDLLWMQIKQYKDDQQPVSKQQVLRKADQELMLKARKELIKDLKNPPDIAELAKRVGTNQNKLKKGFRRMFEKSVGDLLRDERLNHAKILLAEENLSVKEIAEAVGYRNKSAFTKRFKEKFGIVPSAFLNRYRHK